MRRLLAWWRERRDARAEYSASLEEMSFHVEAETERNIRNGMTPDEARREALRVFGGIDRFAEAAARRAFGKSAARLSDREAAILASAWSRACSTWAMSSAVSMPVSPPSCTGFSSPKLRVSLPMKKVTTAMKKNRRNGLT